MQHNESNFLNVFEQIGSRFTSATGQSISFIGRGGEWKSSLNLESFTGFCHRVISSERGHQLCCECNNAFERTSNGNIDISQCHMGGSLVSVPVRTENNDLLISYGQFLLEGTRDEFYAALPDNSRKLGIDYDELRKLAKDLRIYSKRELEDRIELLKLFSNYVNVTESELQARNNYYRECQEKQEIENRLSSLEFESMKTQINQTFITDTLAAIMNVAYKEHAEQTAGMLYDLLYILLKSNTLKDSAMSPEEKEAFVEEFKRFQTSVFPLCHHISGADETKEEIKERSSKVILKACAIIRARYAEPVSLEMVAKELYITPMYLSRIFKKGTGKNFREYLIEVRMSKAQKLLKTGELTVHEIASMVGYDDASYFSRSYKRQFGCTPKQESPNR